MLLIQICQHDVKCRQGTGEQIVLPCSGEIHTNVIGGSQAWHGKPAGQEGGGGGGQDGDEGVEIRWPEEQCATFSFRLN